MPSHGKLVIPALEMVVRRCFRPRSEVRVGRRRNAELPRKSDEQVNVRARLHGHVAVLSTMQCVVIDVRGVLQPQASPRACRYDAVVLPRGEFGHGPRSHRFNAQQALG